MTTTNNVATTETQVAVKEVKLSAKAQAASDAFKASATSYSAIADEQRAKLSDEESDVQAREIAKKQMQRAETHSAYNSKLADMSDKALRLLETYKITDLSKLSEASSASRELKKRTIAALEAIAAKQRVSKDNALDAVCYMLASQEHAELSIAAIQKQMNHKTETQASYFKRFAEFFKFATYNKNTAKLEINYESKFLKDLLSAYQSN